MLLICTVVAWWFTMGTAMAADMHSPPVPGLRLMWETRDVQRFCREFNTAANTCFRLHIRGDKLCRFAASRNLTTARAFAEQVARGTLRGEGLSDEHTPELAEWMVTECPRWSGLPRGFWKQAVFPNPTREHHARSWIGVAIQPVTPDLAREFGLAEAAGVMVLDVTQNGPADHAGMRPGDVITHIQGEVVTRNFDFADRIARTPAGTSTTLTVIRDGTVHTIPVVVADHDTQHLLKERQLTKDERYFQSHRECVMAQQNRWRGNFSEERKVIDECCAQITE